MDRKQIGLALGMRALGLDFTTDSFTDRLILQKAIYLAQAAGINLGYYHRWYLYGPYCSTLAEDAFAVEMEISPDEDESKGWKFDDASQDRANTLRGWVRGDVPPEDREALAKRLELLASVHFLIDRKQVKLNRTQARRGNVTPGNVTEITETLHRFGKDFDETQVKEALGELTENGLLS